MFREACICGGEIELPESFVGEATGCPGCGTEVTVLAREGRAEAASGRLKVKGGPDLAGSLFLLAGEGPIEVGKLEGKHLRLTGGTRVSRSHCRIVRDGQGWKIEDEGSKNGLFVNGDKVSSRELATGDLIAVGDYELEFGVAKSATGAEEEEEGQFLASLDSMAAVIEKAPKVSRPIDDGEIGLAPLAPAAPRKPKVANDGPECPSCGDRLPSNGKFCVACGIDVKTGRAILTSAGIDENDLAIRCDTWIKITSIFVWFGFYPVASEAFGLRKPYAVWSIAAITIITSIIFAIAINADGGWERNKNLMMWCGDPAKAITARNADKLIDRELDRAEKDGGKKFSPEQERQIREGIKARLAEREEEQAPGEFHAYQLLTNALLHDPDGVRSFLLHLGGNMLFLFVFGTGVNSLIGNVRTAIIYPVLAILASLAHLISMSGGRPGAALGASGAIMGLAGMYIVLFPVHRVYMAVWLRRFFRVYYKVWPMRGFWVVLIWIAFDVFATLMRSRDGVAHWAHLGGFIAGVVIALGLLLTRQVDARGGDILSAMLGKKAWAILGKPGSRA